MALMKAKARQTSAISTVSEGADSYLRSLRDGTLLSAEWILAQTIRGRLMCASAGSLTTPITWTGTATNDQTKAAVMVDVPSGTTIFPLQIDLQMEAYGTNALFECAASTGSGGVSAGGSAVTVKNMRSDAPYSTNCTVTSDLTGGTALTTNDAEFWHSGLAIAITMATAVNNIANCGKDFYHFGWKYKDGLFCPIVVGAGQLVVTQGSQAGTGFCKVFWIEVPTTEIT